MSDESYFEGAVLLLDIEREFARFMLEHPERAEQMIADCRVQLATITPFEGGPLPSTGAAAVIGYLAGRGMLDDVEAYYGMLFIGAMQRAEVAGASTQEGS